MSTELNLTELRTRFECETEEIRRTLATKPLCSVCMKPLGTCCVEWRWEPGADYIPVGDDRQMLMDTESEE